MFRSLTTVVFAGMLLCMLCEGQQIALVPIIDGARNPEKIPDDLAYQHLFLAVAASDQSTLPERQRQDAQLAPLSLTPADKATLVSQLARMKTQLEAIERAREEAAAGAMNPSLLAKIRAQQDSTIMKTIENVRHGLSADGVERLNSHIANTVKKNIIVYGLAE